MRRFFKFIYQLGLRKPYQSIDTLHYLKRLSRGKKSSGDEWYFSPRDLAQFRDDSVLVRGRFRGVSFWFYCDRGIKVERNMIRDGIYEPALMDWVSDWVRPGTIVVDVGANVGGVAIPLAIAHPEATVDAFEPNPHALVRFRRNLTLNPLTNLRLYEKGVGREPGSMELQAFTGKDLGLSSFLDPRDSDDKRETVSVDIVNLDRIYLKEDRRISVIKIDVQGYERHVLAGAAGVIARDRPHIVFEHEDINLGTPQEAQAAKNDIRKFFDEHGYRVFFPTKYNPDRLFPVIWDRPLAGNLLALPAHDF